MVHLFLGVVACLPPQQQPTCTSSPRPLLPPPSLAVYRQCRPILPPPPPPTPLLLPPPREGLDRGLWPRPPLVLVGRHPQTPGRFNLLRPHRNHQNRGDKTPGEKTTFVLHHGLVLSHSHTRVDENLLLTHGKAKTT